MNSLDSLLSREVIAPDADIIDALNRFQHNEHDRDELINELVDNRSPLNDDLAIRMNKPDLRRYLDRYLTRLGVDAQDTHDPVQAMMLYYSRNLIPIRWTHHSDAWMPRGGTRLMDISAILRSSNSPDLVDAIPIGFMYLLEQGEVDAAMEILRIADELQIEFPVSLPLGMFVLGVPYEAISNAFDLLRGRMSNKDYLMSLLSIRMGDVGTIESPSFAHVVYSLAIMAEEIRLDGITNAIDPNSYGPGNIYSARRKIDHEIQKRTAIIAGDDARSLVTMELGLTGPRPPNAYTVQQLTESSMYLMPRVAELHRIEPLVGLIERYNGDVYNIVDAGASGGLEFTVRLLDRVRGREP